MKQLILFILLFVGITTTIVAQDSIQYVTNSDTEKLIDKYTAKIEASVVALAQSLKQPAEHVYKILVKQQQVKATATLIAIGSLIILGILLIIIECVFLNWNDYIVGMIGIILLLIGVIGLVISASSIVSGFTNPEYGAIKDIVRFLK